MFPARLLLAGAALALAAACGGDKPPTPDTPSAAPPASDPLALGATKYQQVCMSCHQNEGQGSPGVFPPLAGSEWVTGDPEIPIAIVLHGLQGRVVVKGETYESAMQPWGMIPDSDIAAIVTYVRASWGNNASPVTTEQVAAIRAAEGGRVAWTVDELREKYPGK